jgi:hypothetical protein
VALAKRILRWWCFNTAMDEFNPPELADLTGLCPSCGQTNQCVVAQGGHIEDCWCMSVTMGARVLEGLANQECCVCASCAAGVVGAAEIQ